MELTIGLHPYVQAFTQSACLTAVPVPLVNNAGIVVITVVLCTCSYTSSEEALAGLTGHHSKVVP